MLDRSFQRRWSEPLAASQIAEVPAELAALVSYVPKKTCYNAASVTAGPSPRLGEGIEKGGNKRLERRGREQEDGGPTLLRCQPVIGLHILRKQATYR